MDYCDHNRIPIEGVREIAQSIPWYSSPFRHVVEHGQSERAKYSRNYALCSVFCRLYSEIWALCFVYIIGFWRGVGDFMNKDTQWIRFIEVFVECHVFKFDKPCAQAYFITWLPSPTQCRAWGKKADMFEGNVLVKKYRGGRQEDYLKKDFAFLGFTSRHLFLFLF